MILEPGAYSDLMQSEPGRALGFLRKMSLTEEYEAVLRIDHQNRRFSSS